MTPRTRSLQWSLASSPPNTRQPRKVWYTRETRESREPWRRPDTTTLPPAWESLGHPTFRRDFWERLSADQARLVFDWVRECSTPQFKTRRCIGFSEQLPSVNIGGPLLLLCSRNLSEAGPAESPRGRNSR